MPILRTSSLTLLPAVALLCGSLQTAWGQPSAEPGANPGDAKKADDKVAPAKKAAPAKDAKPDKKDTPAKKEAAAPDKKAAPTPDKEAASPPEAKKEPAPVEPEAEPAPKELPPPTAAEMEEAKQAFLEGRRLFDDEKNFSGAVDQFKKSYRLSRNPLLLYNIGYTLDEMKETNLAVFYYEKFLKDAPEESANRDVAKDRLRVLKRQLDADAVFDTGSGKKPDKKPDKQPDKQPDKTDVAVITTFQHNVVEEAPPGKPLDLTAFVPDNAKWQVTLFFRGPGSKKFESTVMRPRYNELVGRIPAQVMAGSSVQYYIEARNQQGAMVARSGRSTSPNLVFLDDDAKPRYYPDLTTDRSWEGAGTSRVSHRTNTGGNSGGGTATGWGRFSDTGSKKFRYAKWGATGTAATLLTLSVTFYFISANSASNLEAEAAYSGNECADPPCRAFSDHQKSIQDYGQRFETMSNVALAFGVVTAGAAGYLWYKDLKQRRRKQQAAGSQDQGRRFATPVVGKDFLGAAATVRF